MKLNKITTYAAVLAAMSMVSCTEGKYWEEASNPGEVYAFAKPAETVSLLDSETIPSSYDVVVSRNNAGASVTIPVKFTASAGSESVLSGPSEVTFESGSSSAVYTINIADGAKAGVNYGATLLLTQPEDALVHVNTSNLKYTFTLTKELVLNWQDNGVALTFSSWAGNESPVEIPVQEAVNWPVDGQRLMRLVSPYWYLEPAYAEEGYNVQYYLDADGNAAGMYATYQMMGEDYDGNSVLWFGCPANYGGYFANQDNIYTMNGVVGYGTSAASVTPGWYETLQFQWSE